MMHGSHLDCAEGHGSNPSCPTSHFAQAAAPGVLRRQKHPLNQKSTKKHSCTNQRVREGVSEKQEDNWGRIHTKKRQNKFQIN